MKRTAKIALPLIALSAMLAACGGDEPAGSGDTADVAESYPERPVDYIIAFDPGGESDITARLQQEPLQEVLGTDVTISYKPGGGGALAWSELTRTEPDGHTIMGHNLPHIILQPMMREDAGYETDQLKQVYIFQSTPNILAVPADSDIQTLDDFIAAAKENPGAMSVGGSGDFSANHVGTLLLNDEAGIETTYTPFSGTGAAVPALLGGHVDALMTYTPMISQLGDQIRTLAVATDERLPGLEDYPTFTEQGIDLVDGAYRGVAVPPETPDAIVEKLAGVFAEVNEDPELAQQFEEQGFVLENMGPEEATEFTAERTEVYQDLFERLGML
ncbi:tripartite tricarboxylate transporter substrate binding protein [Georgenia sp. EYE_87]|uniref:Bug family tripartite tricarboxylate transporter substrate binding protein n=1 Tax=Georgenia sp. EYE_87 TaxID=2853448 RepID=UPI002005A5CD|nr:tripartite tricarboxylate transporter substrate binding protein [Georgenia sp. EYE_87]MCK6210864.1 tripartite tricarboxylate transporter substrate binding protein [Georgenia sp. EYE_87]